MSEEQSRNAAVRGFERTSLAPMRDAGKAFTLCVARLEVAVAALADEYWRLFGAFYPPPPFHEGLANDREIMTRTLYRAGRFGLTLLHRFR